LQRVLGITDVNYVVSGRSLAVVDSPLGDAGASASGTASTHLSVVDPIHG
jgi:hypothetical protein